MGISRREFGSLAGEYMTTTCSPLKMSRTQVDGFALLLLPLKVEVTGISMDLWVADKRHQLLTSDGGSARLEAWDVKTQRGIKACLLCRLYTAGRMGEEPVQG